MQLTPQEQRLLLCCARQDLDEDLAERAREAMQSPIRWEWLHAESGRHGVTVLLYAHLKKAFAAETAHLPVMDRLRESYLRSIFRQGHRFKALAEVVSAFRDRGVDPLVLKGPDLAGRVYRNSPCRLFGDLDLLIRPADFRTARDTLLELGYRPQAGRLSEKFSLGYHFNLGFSQHRAVHLEVELHWALTDRFTGLRPDLEGLFDRSVLQETEHGAFRVLELEDLVLHLAIHLGVHGYLNPALLERENPLPLVCHPHSENRLIWFTDLHEILSSDYLELDWDRLIQRASNWKARTHLAVTLRLVQKLFGTPLNEQAMSRMEPAAASRLQRTLARRLAEQPEGAFWPSFLLTRGKAMAFRPIRLLDLPSYLGASLRKGS